jgi:hypothetical protein
MFEFEELLIWESEQRLKETQFKIKSHKNPRREKTRDYRKGIKSGHFDKESKSARKDDYRLYRTQMKHLIKTEQYELIRKYQRTSGWLTW